MNRAADCTGVPVLPGDTPGYLFDGCAHSYRTLRWAIAEWWRATPHAEVRLHLEAEARWANQVHLRRMLRAAVFLRHGDAGWKQIDRWGTENLPRAQRRMWQAASCAR